MDDDQMMIEDDGRMVDVGRVTNHEEEELWDEKWAIDDTTGKELDPKAVEEARREEVEFMKSIELYDEVDVQECLDMTGKHPTSTRWIDVDKGTEVRCRLVARDFKGHGEGERADLFAATPPLEALRMILRMAMVKRVRKRWGGQQGKIMVIDVKKAHLNAKLEEGEMVYVSLPEEAEANGKCGRLKRWLYGMRPAAGAWEKDYCKNLEGIGFVRGKAAPTVFRNEKSGTMAFVHGDDFVFLGAEEDLRRVREEMAGWYQIKVKAVMGPGKGDDKEVVILGRKVKWMGDRITYEADPRIVGRIVEAAGLREDSKGLDCMAVKGEEDEGEEKLNESEAKEFRSNAALANYLALDRADLQFAVGLLCRDMSSPTQASERAMKRVARYLVRYPRMVWEFREVEELGHIAVYADSDWAGDLRSRRSTSGGVVTIGTTAVKTWSRRQATVALSSGEAEFCAVVKATAEALGVQALAEDLGEMMKIAVYSDSSAARGIASRTGLGKIRHLDVRLMWVQELVKNGKIMLRKVKGTENPADMLTKPKNALELRTQSSWINADIVK